MQSLTESLACGWIELIHVVGVGESAQELAYLALGGAFFNVQRPEHLPRMFFNVPNRGGTTLHVVVNDQPEHRRQNQQQNLPETDAE